MAKWERGGEHPYFDRADWRYEVANGDTRLGYDDWVEHNLEAVEHDRDTGVITEADYELITGGE